MKFSKILFLVLAVVWGAVVGKAWASVEIEGWGDLRGFRIDGQLMQVTTSLRVARPDWKEAISTGHWQQRQLHFTHDGDDQIYRGQIAFKDGQALDYRYVIHDLGADGVAMKLQITPQADMQLEGLYFSVSAPLEDYAGATAELVNVKAPATRSSEISTTRPATDRRYLRGVASGVRLTGPHRRLWVDFDSPTDVLVQDVKDPRGDKISTLISLRPGNAIKDQVISASLTLRTSGDADHEPARLVLDAVNRGSVFNGIGGNFVFGLDSPIVKYNLEHLNLVWSRMAMSLREWEPVQIPDPSPATLAANDQPGTEMRASLELAQHFQRRSIPLIMSLWVAPPWALSNPKADEPYAQGRIVNPAKWDALCQSITSYLLYAREHYGVEPTLFSLNESDLGVTIHLTPKEYCDVIKKLGSCFASQGLTTKILLGDVSYPGAVDFINSVADDPQALSYIGAVSYHSWNGATLETLAAWRNAARKLGLPLLVAEGGMDSDAYRYPFILNETWYAMEEGALYLDVLTQSQPLSILPWELTTDYGLIDLSRGTLQPTKRFWFLKQLSDTTGTGAAHLAISTDHSAIHAAAFFETGENGYSIHLINTGASRQVSIGQIPADVHNFQCYLTDSNDDFHKIEAVPVQGGVARLKLPAMSFVTLTSGQ